MLNSYAVLKDVVRLLGGSGHQENVLERSGLWVVAGEKKINGVSSKVGWAPRGRKRLG